MIIELDFTLSILSNKLIAAGIPFISVSGNEPPYVVEFAPESTQAQRDQAAAIVAAFDPVAEVAAYEAKIQAERLDLSDLLPKIATELNYIDTTLLGIDGMTTTQVRAVVKRILQEQSAELKAWRYVIRELTGRHNGT